MSFVIKIIKKIVSFRFSLLILLKLDNLIYKLITLSAIENENGIHPKHEIIQYEKWFLDQIKESDTVLDIGSNLGDMAQKMSLKCNLVYGIEINEESALKAKKLETSKLKFFCEDALEFDYNKLEKIDLITLSNVLEHIENRVVFINKLISEVIWKSKPQFLIRVPMIDREWISVYKKQLGIEWRLDNTHFTEYDLEQFKKEMNENNLVINYHFVKFGELFASCSQN